MDIQDVIKNRYSVRCYKPDPVEDEKLEQILEAARLAPTAHNNQPFQVIVIHTSGRKDELKEIYGRSFFTEPPLILCVCVVHSQSWTRGIDRRGFYDVDVAIVMDHMILTATALGLGTCWIGAFNPGPARELLQLPEDVEPLLFTPLGYAADLPKPKERKPLSELVRYEHW
jgi:nitroreductase